MDECLYMVIFWQSEIYCVKLICAPWVKGVDGLGTEDQSATCFVCQYKVWFGLVEVCVSTRARTSFRKLASISVDGPPILLLLDFVRFCNHRTLYLFEINRLKDAQLLVFIKNVPWFRKVDIANRGRCLSVRKTAVCLSVCE